MFIMAIPTIFTGLNRVDSHNVTIDYQIFSIARCKGAGENCFVTSDEDRTVRFWRNGVNVESFQLPAQSVWSVACLSNGDIVTGSSDGVVRVFTQSESRYADQATVNKFTEEVEVLTKQSTQEIGGYKISECV
jgi:phospholipase A-2-activating protein